MMKGDRKVLLRSLATLVFALVSLISFGGSVACPQCGNLIGDAFCTNCGTKRPVATAVDHVADHNPYYLAYPVGFFRGLAEVVCSPLNTIRGGIGWANTVVVYCRNNKDKASGNLIGIPVMFTMGMVIGCIPMTGDLCVGCADMLTLGAVGNETDIWNDSISTPYIFERTWIKEESHGKSNACFRFVK